MVVRFVLKIQLKNNQKVLYKRRQMPWFIIGSIFLFFITIFLLRNCVCQILLNGGNDVVISGLRGKNYEALYEIYSDSRQHYKRIEVLEDFETKNIPEHVTLDTFRVACYYVISNITKAWQLPPNAIDPYLCTHIIVGFACVNNATIQPKLPTDKEVYKTIVNFKNLNPSLKIIISVEEFSSSGEFARVVSSDELRNTFVRNTLTFLNSTGFDGVDLDWEFPSWPDENLIQVRNYTLLLREFRQLINSNYSGIGKKFLLSVAVGAPYLIIRQSYEINEMAEVVDFVNLMSYDYHMFSQYLPLTGPNAPLYQRTADVGYMVTLNTNWSATHWAMWGMPLSKINVGIPTFGHSFRLVNEDNNGWNAPASGFGKAGAGNGFISYSDACKFIDDPSTTHIFDDEYNVPYAYNRYEWISYDNPTSVQLKAEYVKKNQFGGAMIYSLNCDDFSGICSPQKFPLTRIVSNILTG